MDLDRTERIDKIGHSLERTFNSTARDILDAVESGFRTKVDVKGKLAELYLFRTLTALQEQGSISELIWSDIDGEPDFFIEYQKHHLSIQCKNVRSGELYKTGERKGKFKVELQKTRGGTDLKTGEKTRYYHPDEFDIVAVCLFNQTGNWEFLYAMAKDLARHRKHGNRLEVMHPVPPRASPPWNNNLLDILQSFHSIS